MLWGIKVNDKEGLLTGWQPASKAIASIMPFNLHDWLLEAKAITPMLQMHFTDWELQVFSQKWQQLLSDELAPLMTDDPQAWVREIFHLGNGKKQIYAKLSVPELTYSQFQTQLDGLGQKPVGAALFFNNPEVVRSAFDYKLINSNEPAYFAACRQLGDETILWARRSVFTFKGQHRFLLTELFSQSLPKM